jgi:hypothetical protein
VIGPRHRSCMKPFCSAVRLFVAIVRWSTCTQSLHFGSFALHWATFSSYLSALMTPHRNIRKEEIIVSLFPNELCNGMPNVAVWPVLRNVHTRRHTNCPSVSTSKRKHATQQRLK